MRRTTRIVISSISVAVVLVAIGTVAVAQATGGASQTPAGTATTVATDKKPFKAEELAALLAPIALYPDPVVTQILMASTYPIEVVEASHWLEKNSSLKGEALAKEAEKQSWDQSVKGLCALPDVIKMMDAKIDWTQKVGDAFLAQQKEVMDTIQSLRAQAQKAGNLKSDDHMKVTSQPAPAANGTTATSTAAASSSPQVIVIESANPQVVYVPTYNPTTIYGSWAYPAYPPYYYPPMGYAGAGFFWGAAIGFSVAYWGGSWGHCYPDWHGGSINVGEINIDRGDRNRNQINPNDRGRGSGNQKWEHNPEHRKGASYRDNSTASKYGGGDRATASTRDSYRGRTSAGTSDVRGGGAGAGGRDLGPTASTRDAGSRGGTPTAGSRGGASAGTRDTGSGSRGGSSSYGGGSRGGSSSAFSGMSGGGSRASSSASRGGFSRGGGGRRR